jgi:hypothetical protein
MERQVTLLEEKEAIMRIGRSILTMLLCSGVLFALGLPGCGDDDDEGGDAMTCEDAFDTLTSDTCVQGAAGVATEVLQPCVLACDPPGNEACVGDCVLGFVAFLPAPCAEAVGYLTQEAPDDCRECYVPCRDAFLGCALSFAVPVEDCASDMNDCIELCK